MTERKVLDPFTPGLDGLARMDRAFIQTCVEGPPQVRRAPFGSIDTLVTLASAIVRSGECCRIYSSHHASLGDCLREMAKYPRIMPEIRFPFHESKMEMTKSETTTWDEYKKTTNFDR